MKSELELQAMVISAVTAAGGAAHKMNNRFLVGVSDLIVKLPSRPTDGYKPECNAKANPPAGFIEVKQGPWPRADRFMVEITVPQRHFLQKFYDAGMPVGVMSFLQRGSGTKWRCWLAVMSWPTYNNVDWRREDYVELGHRDDRANIIMTTLYNWQQDWRDGI